jgi:hypothetical protein
MGLEEAEQLLPRRDGLAAEDAAGGLGDGAIDERQVPAEARAEALRPVVQPLDDEHAEDDPDRGAAAATRQRGGGAASQVGYDLPHDEVVGAQPVELPRLRLDAGQELRHERERVGRRAAADEHGRVLPRSGRGAKAHPTVAAGPRPAAFRTGN